MATASTRTRPTNLYSREWEAFCKNTAKHSLSVIKDDGLHRHLRMSENGTSMWHWDIVTWPGHLAIVGDIADGFTFRRAADMIDFFTIPQYSQNYYSDGSPCIDFRYWAQKLGDGSRHAAEEYSPEAFVQYVRDEIDNDEFGDDLDESTREMLIAEASDNRDTIYTASEWLARHEGIHNGLFSDYWEADFNRYTFQFVLACYAIEHTVREWNKLKDTEHGQTIN